MRPKTLLTLLLVVLALAGFIWFVERDLPSSDERQELAKRVLAIEAEEVRAIELRVDGRTVRLERQPVPDGEEGEVSGDWNLTQPLSARANGLAVDGLVYDLVELRKQRTLEEVDLAALGLDAPRGQVVLETAEGTETLSIGGEIPASSDMIVARTGDPDVFVVAAGVWGDIAKVPGEWRSRDVFAVDSEDVERVVLRGPSGEIELARRAGTVWIEAPLVDRADADDASALFDDLTRLRVQSFVDDPSEGLAELGLAPPERVVEMELGDGAEGLRLEIGSADPEREGQRYARTDGQVMRIDDTLDEALERAAADWQSTSWTDLKVWEMDRLTIEEDGDSFELAKQAGEWRRGQEVISHSRVSDFLYALAGATAERLISVDEGRLLGAAVDSPVLRILVETGEGSEELTLLAPLEIGVPARSAGRDYLALLAAATVEDLRAKLEDVRTAESPSDDGESPEDG